MNFNTYKLDDNSKSFYNISNERLFLDDLEYKTIVFEKNLEKIFNSILENNFHNDETIILLEYAGFGDTIHTKLLIQHLELLYKNIIWITLEEIKDLYKEHTDLFIYSNKINNILRNPAVKITQDYSSHINNIFFNVFVNFKNKINISDAICKTFLEKNNFSLWERYYNIIDIKRNFNIKHLINHTKNFEYLSNKPIITFEHSSITFSTLSKTENYQKITNILSRDYNIVLVGSKNDILLDNISIDYRGKSFYDVYSVIKDSKFFIGRNSGNQCITVFNNKLPVIEIDTVGNSFIESKYKDNCFKASSVEHLLKIIELLRQGK